MYNQEVLQDFFQSLEKLVESAVEKKISEALERQSVVKEQEDPDRLVSRQEAAEIFLAHPNTISQWFKSDSRIKNYGRGRKLLFSLKELKAASIQRYVR